MAQEEGAQQIMCHHLKKSGVAKLLRWCTNASMGEWCSHTPTIFAVPKVAFAEPYAHLPQPQQNVATIGGYATRNMQNIAAILTNAKQMGEGNANVAYVLGHLHLAPSDNSYEERRNFIMSKGTTTKTININHRRKIRERRSFSYLSFTPFSLIFSLSAPMFA
jgi:hypothetical protein